MKNLEHSSLCQLNIVAAFNAADLRFKPREGYFINYFNSIFRFGAQRLETNPNLEKIICFYYPHIHIHISTYNRVYDCRVECI